jgi:hypothetical protein
MPRVVVPVQVAARTGILLGAAGTEVTGDATNHHYFANTGKEVILARNTGAGARTVTLEVVANVDGGTITNPTVSIAAGATRAIGPFPRGLYEQASDPPNVYFRVEHAEVKLQVLQVG